MNNIALVGRLTRDPELRTASTGNNMAKFAIAVDRRFKREGEPTADFFNVVVFGKAADFVGNYLTKGRLVSVTGRIEIRKYVDKDGNNREAVEVTADNVNGLDRPRDDEGGGGGGGQRARMSAAPSEDEIDPFDVD
ncbi:MAG: single-stranded DNA-binding protein [Armatimonadota bacterium]